MVKRVRRLVSGHTEVARICGRQRHHGNAEVVHTAQMTSALWHEWSTSKKLQDLFVAHAKDPAMSVDEVTDKICGTKRIGQDTTV